MTKLWFWKNNNFGCQTLIQTTKIIIINKLLILHTHTHTRDGTVHVFVPNRHGTGIPVRYMRPYDEYRHFPPNPEGGASSNATLFDNCQQSRRTANANGDTEAAALMFGSLHFILIKYQLAVKLCLFVCACARAPARSLQLFPYTSRINFKHLMSY